MASPLRELAPFFWANRKKPDAIKKKGTATRASILVRTKSVVSLTEVSGEVWIVTTRKEAIILNLSIPV
jgi:hypothetical protein